MKWDKVRVKVKSKERVEMEGKKIRGRKGGTAGPGKRWGHTCNTVKHGRTLYVFGGYGKDNRQTNDVYVFDYPKQTWSKPMVKGDSPSPRDSHSCTTVGTCLYVFGGTDGRCPLNDLYILDTVSNTWTRPEIQGEGPAPREGHSAALIGQCLFIFGGCGKSSDDSEEIYYNDLYILDTVQLVWNKAVTKGTPPAPRDSHTCSAWNNKLLVLGGEDASDSYLSDVHILDTDTMEWRELQTGGQRLLPRAGHATVSLGKHLFVFGGFTDDRNLFDDLYMLNIETGIWTKQTATGIGPSARFSVAGDCISPRSGVLVFIGGCNENLEALDDMFLLETDIRMDSGNDEKPEKLSLRKELKRKRQESQILVSQPEKEKESPQFISNSVPTDAPQAGAGSADKLAMYDFKPSDEKVFEAKITDVFHYGYTIESIIDGKQLRGLLFSYKPGFSHAVHSYLSRKRLGADGSDSVVKKARKRRLRIARSPNHISDQGAEDQIIKVSASEHGSIGEPISKQTSAFSDQYQQHVQHPVPTASPAGMQQDGGYTVGLANTGLYHSGPGVPRHSATEQVGAYSMKSHSSIAQKGYKPHEGVIMQQSQSQPQQ